MTWCLWFSVTLNIVLAWILVRQSIFILWMHRVMKEAFRDDIELVELMEARAVRTPDSPGDIFSRN